MRIAILGWGSLLWETQPGFDQLHDDWHFDGPVLEASERTAISKTHSPRGSDRGEGRNLVRLSKTRRARRSVARRFPHETDDAE